MSCIVVGASVLVVPPCDSWDESQGPITGLEPVQFPNGATVTPIAIQETEDFLQVSGAAVSLETDEFGPQTILFRDFSGEGLTLLHEVSRIVSDDDFTLNLLLSQIFKGHPNVQISVFDREWLPPHMRHKYDIIVQHPENPSSSKKLHVLQLESKPNSLNIQAEEIQFPEMTANQSIPPKTGILMILTHHHHEHPNVNELLRQAFCHDVGEMFGEKIGDEAHPRYLDGEGGGGDHGMVFSLDDFRVTVDGVVATQLEIGFRTGSRTFCCLSAGETGLFDAISAEIEGDLVNSVNFLGCGSLACFMISKLFRRYNHVLEYCEERIGSFERKMNRGTDRIKESEIEGFVEEMAEVVNKVSEQLDKASEVFESLRQSAEVEKSLFEQRHPADPLNAVQAVHEKLSKRISHIDRSLGTFKRDAQEALEKKSEIPLKLIEQASVLAAGVVGIPIAAEFFERTMEKHLPILAWSIATAGFLFTAGTYYTLRALKHRNPPR